jgi:hypothetical protein
MLNACILRLSKARRRGKGAVNAHIWKGSAC